MGSSDQSLCVAEKHLRPCFPNLDGKKDFGRGLPEGIVENEIFSIHRASAN
jgi:hypothetical protein